MIITDDQGPWAMPHLMPELHMPELDALRRDSIEFTRAYCPSPVCSPARASMLTGRTPSAHGVHDWLVGTRHPDVYPDLYLAGQPTTPEVLADAGYRCGLSGKWHVGDSRLPAPGFEYWYAHRYGGGPYHDAPIWLDGREATEPAYLSDAITDHAVEFLSEPDPRPFWLSVNFTAPHTPWLDNHPADLLDLYTGCDFASVPRQPPHPWTAGRPEFRGAFADPVPNLAGYCAALSGVDRGLGRIRRTLDQHGLTDDTMIILVSDNGFSCGHHGIWGKGNGTSPLNFFDNSVRVPLVVHLPGGPVGVRDAPVSTRWVHRSVCQLTGVEPPTDQWGDSGSFVSALTTSTPPVGSSAVGSPDELVVVTAEYGQGRMITDGRYVYVHRSNGPDELYDHDRDPTEETNFVADPALATTGAELRIALLDWFNRHERAGQSAFEQPVSGFGQLQPTARGLGPAASYLPLTPVDD
ncbi:sulfatase-like hydrolase/transferase [Microlunatus sp. Y2014]|uniref:sulfatase-like hydrolase/transferase n=1 Tax=Microlunatus sp. Y2014 TaxID=3418488 RepID=UPI003DA6F1B2